MGLFGGSVPEALDFAGTAVNQNVAEQNAINNQTLANRAAQETPWGTLSWANDRQFNQAAYDMALKEWEDQFSNLSKKAQKKKGEEYAAYMAQKPTQSQYMQDNWTQSVNLSPEQQRALESQQAIQQRLSDMAMGRLDDIEGQMGKTPDWGSLQQMSSFDPQSAQKYFDDSANAYMAQWNQRVGSNFGDQTAQMEQQLRNRGLKPGDVAYDKALKQLTDQQGYMTNDANNAAFMQGANDASRLFGIDLSGANYQNQASNQAMQQQAFKDNYGLNQLTSLLSGQQVQMPQFSGYSQAGTAGGPDYQWAAEQQYGANKDAAAAKGSMMGSILGAVGSIGGSIMGGPMGGMIGGQLGGMLGGG